jgi:hypothetical protein
MSMGALPQQPDLHYEAEMSTLRIFVLILSVVAIVVGGLWYFVFVWFGGHFA